MLIDIYIYLYLWQCSKTVKNTRNQQSIHIISHHYLVDRTVNLRVRNGLCHPFLRNCRWFIFGFTTLYCMWLVCVCILMWFFLLATHDQIDNRSHFSSFFSNVNRKKGNASSIRTAEVRDICPMALRLLQSSMFVPILLLLPVTFFDGGAMSPFPAACRGCSKDCAKTCSSERTFLGPAVETWQFEISLGGWGNLCAAKLDVFSWKWAPLVSLDGSNRWSLRWS